MSFGLKMEKISKDWRNDIYDVFKSMYDQDQDLQNVVADFDQDKIVIKTDKESEADPEMDFDNQGSTDTVKQMAKSAMNRRK